MTDDEQQQRDLGLWATIAMGTGVMIGAGIFALTGQIAELAGPLFPLAFLLAAGVSALSAYSYAKVAGANPSSGGIAMILSDAYGRGAITAACSMLMAFSMIINESLVARTFGTYSAELLDVGSRDLLVPVLAFGLILIAFAINLVGNRAIGSISIGAALVKVVGIVAFAGAALWAAGFGFEAAADGAGTDATLDGLLAATALAILAFKGFTTITNSGDEIREPGRNIGRSIAASLGISLAVYLLVAYAVGSTLTIPEIVAAKDYSLAEAARPGLGNAGLTFTVLIAIVATASGLLASLFAVSRMLAMLTEMELIPHRHFGMPGGIRQHTLVYTVVVAGLLAVFFDLSRIAAIGAIFYLVMDIAIQWGVARGLASDVGAKRWVPLAAASADLIALAAFVLLKASSDPLVVAVGFSGVAATFAFEAAYLRFKGADSAG